MPHLYFFIKEPEKTGRALIWDTRTLSIGRAPENDLTLEDDEVSRKHALLINEGGVCEIGDYRTGNGTFVNGQRVNQKQKIKPGDVIAIGKVQLEFRLGKEHPAKLGLRLEYASQLKTAGLLPQGADAGSTMLGLVDTAPPRDDFVVVPQRSAGVKAFVAGREGERDFQVRELDESLDKIELTFDGDLDLVDLANAPPLGEPFSEAAEPNPATAPAIDPVERLRKLKGLHDEGLITDEEFQTKRAEILREM